MSLTERIRRREAVVGVIGLGRVGLPLAIAFAESGFRVMGVDPDDTLRSTIELGKLPFHEPGAEQPLLEAITSEALSVHAGAAEVASSVDVLVLAVGTPLGPDLRADYSQLRSALMDLGPHLHEGQLVILRSTVSPGTLLKVVLPTLGEGAPDGLPSVMLAACPERIAEGRAMEELRSLPEIVGGIDGPSAEAASELWNRSISRLYGARASPTSRPATKTARKPEPCATAAAP